jgi:hypothetical protein
MRFSKDINLTKRYFHVMCTSHILFLLHIQHTMGWDPPCFVLRAPAPCVPSATRLSVLASWKINADAKLSTHLERISYIKPLKIK